MRARTLYHSILFLTHQLTEMYSLARGECLLSESAHSSAISALRVLSERGRTQIATADTEGAIKIFSVKQSDQDAKLSLSCVFVSEREDSSKRRAITTIYNTGRKCVSILIT